MKIKQLDPQSLTAIFSSEGGNGWKHDPASWADTAREAEKGQRLVLVAYTDGEVAGYGSLIWRSAYPPFRREGIPEIHDLVTAQRYRGQGVATGLINTFEREAAGRRHSIIGLGVGLYADYGDAQRLYASLGYRPDGNGITYNYQPIAPGSMARVDDDLVLWLTKKLGAKVVD